MVDWEERRQLVKIANLYYGENWTQEQIAKKFSVSRPIISKSLQKARDIGIVEVYINDQTIHTVSLEQDLEKEFNLIDAKVVPSSSKSDITLHAVGRAAANYLSKNLKDVKSIGISWGETLTTFVNEYPFQLNEDIKIVPLEGGMGRKKVEIHANQLAYELGKKMGAECSFLYAPAIVESEELLNRLLSMDDINAVIEEGKNVDIGLISLGNPFENSTLESLGYLDEGDLSKLKELGVVGDIGFRFFNEMGNKVDNPFSKKMVGLSLEDLKNIKKVIAVVSGVYKADALLAMLRGGYIDILVTDEATANAVLK
ncbi:sugar-binding transcriptional regulator [Paucisalibacillus globulus]|uniref:sugar-binding transcriptional regulator n=1 Tax=Paucisalibacillus globulus TaxID=351095 RepID=UPI000BB82D09|nr:sugar-binding transcriptional regulator [Paucisalibacillus globulus]